MQIKIGKYEVKINPSDWDVISKHNWWIQSGHRDDYKRVATRIKGRYIYMHRLISGAKTGEYVDHINGDSLDNRRENLRICTNMQNIRNQRIRSDNTSGFKGVHKEKSTGIYQAYIWDNYKKISLGRFKTALEAAKAYNEAAVKYFKEYARLNDI